MYVSALYSRVYVKAKSSIGLLLADEVEICSVLNWQGKWNSWLYEEAAHHTWSKDTTIIDLEAQILSIFNSLRGTGTTMHPINFDAEIPQSFCIKGLWVCDTYHLVLLKLCAQKIINCACVCVWYRLREKNWWDGPHPLIIRFTD